jgi:hypothetical protein
VEGGATNDSKHKIIKKKAILIASLKMLKTLKTVPK